jgi:hypothetical protein
MFKIILSITVFFSLNLFAEVFEIGKKAFEGGPSLNYLSAYHDFRNASILYETTLKEQRVAAGEAKKNKTIHEMNTELFKNKAITEMDFNKSQMRLDMSTASASSLESQAEFIKASRDKYSLYMTLSTGKEFDLEDTYAVALRYWNAQCKFFKSQVKESEAMYQFADYDLKANQALYKKDKTLVPYEELLEYEQNFTVAEETLKVRKSLDANCNSDIPSLEFLKSLDPKLRK